MKKMVFGLVLAATFSCTTASAQQSTPPTANSTSPSDQTHITPLELTCMGGGEATKLHSSSAFAFGSGGSAWGTGAYTSESGFQDQVDVRLFGGDDQIRLPRHMLPPIHGGENGWFKLSDIASSDRDITASADINFANHPKVRIDRVTGVINIVGKAGNFVGECRKFDPQAEKPKF